jgi:uncharacterized protein (TIGR03437 family)
MTPRRLAAIGLLLFAGTPIRAKSPSAPGCGTHIDRPQEELYLHRQAERRLGRDRARQRKSAAASSASANRDYGNVAVIDDADGVVGRRNQFNLLQKTVVFSPVDSGSTAYHLAVGGPSYDPDAAAAGTRVDGIGDDDTREIVLPFPFRFFGVGYRSVHVNSDGNLTFEKGDGDTADRSVGRLGGGPPRIAPLFTDLDPSVAASQNGILVLTRPDRFVVTWRNVPVYSNSGSGAPQRVQARLFPDGRIEFAYDDITASEIVTGISPGGAKTPTRLIPLASGSADEFSGTVADRFSNSDAVDIVTAAQKFYETHDDAYDYLVFFNTVGVPAAEGAVAYEVTVRNQRSGYGDSLVDSGSEYGSSRRLQSVINMGPLYQYPSDPNGIVGARGPTGDTPLTILGHETGHLFLAFASVRDPGDPRARPMLGRALVHWAFNFNSEASLLEGNRIQDEGDGAFPRFRTVATVQGYSPLDQYLMGFRTPAEVPTTFVVTNATVPAARAPQSGISFNGTRRNVSVDDIISAEGPRIPDSTVAQRRFRFAFVLIVAAGTPAPQSQIDKVEAFRAAFEAFYAKAASNRAAADTALRRAIQLSAAPAAGVLLDGSGTVTVATASPVEAPLTLMLATSTGAVGVPGSVTIPAGSRQAAFAIRGLREGVDELSAIPADTSYETAVARIQVTGAASRLRLELLSEPSVPVTPGVPMRDPVEVRVVDRNRLPYSGVPVSAVVSSGSLDASTISTDSDGIARFRWTPSTSAGTLRVTLDGGSEITVSAVPLPSVTPNGIVNAASYVPAITPGSLATIFGTLLTAGVTAHAFPPLPFGLSGVQVMVNGLPAQLLYVSDSQINFLVPAAITGETATIEITNPAGSSSPFAAQVRPVSPGIFFGEGNAGAVLIANTGLTTAERPAVAGDYLEIYCTGLGGASADMTQAAIGGVPAMVSSVTALTQFPGLYQINIVVPEGVPSGDQPLVVTANGATSNEVRIRLR